MDMSGKWHFEHVTPDLMMAYKIESVVYSGDTDFQNVEIIDSPAFGRCLVLDDKTQSTSSDERIYHDALVHPAMLFHDTPSSVLIAGGGEGATLREVLRHNYLDKVTMVDLDTEIVSLCHRYLTSHHEGSFDDSRVELIYGDARKYLGSCSTTFDIIILDLVDPLEEGPSYLLYTREFYEIVKSKMNPGGIVVTQGGPAGFGLYSECFTSIVNTMATVFGRVYPYTTFVPAFTTLWGFSIATDINLPYVDSVGINNGTADAVDKLIQERIKGPLSYYDGITHNHMFSLPKYLRYGIEQETRIATDQNPVFMT